MSQVGRQLERKKRVVQEQVFADVLPNGCISSKDVQSTCFIRQFEFLRGAQHALAFHTTQLAEFDLERCRAFCITLFARWQLGPHQGARHLDAHLHIGCATHDLQSSALPDIHLTHIQTIGIGMALDSQHFGHHHTGERWSNRTRFFNFHAGHGEQIGQRLGGQGWIAKLAQPRLRKLHRFSFDSVWVIGH